jgi:putative ABC transport system permease protein
MVWVTQVLFPQTMPEVDAVAYIAPATMLTALLLGVVAVAAAPLLLARRVRRMDVPATLRVLE